MLADNLNNNTDSAEFEKMDLLIIAKLLFPFCNKTLFQNIFAILHEALYERLDIGHSLIYSFWKNANSYFASKIPNTVLCRNCLTNKFSSG